MWDAVRSTRTSPTDMLTAKGRGWARVCRCPCFAVKGTLPCLRALEESRVRCNCKGCCAFHAPDLTDGHARRQPPGQHAQALPALALVERVGDTF